MRNRCLHLSQLHILLNLSVQGRHQRGQEGRLQHVYKFCTWQAKPCGCACNVGLEPTTDTIAQWSLMVDLVQHDLPSIWAGVRMGAAEVAAAGVRQEAGKYECRCLNGCPNTGGAHARTTGSGASLESRHGVQEGCHGTQGKRCACEVGDHKARPVTLRQVRMWVSGGSVGHMSHVGQCGLRRWGHCSSLCWRSRIGR